MAIAHMRFFLSKDCVLKHLEEPSVYHVRRDELYELDLEAFEFLKRCSLREGCEARESEFTDYCLSDGVLTTQGVEAARPPVQKSPVPSLRYLELQITRRCNLRCRHCYLGPPQDRELGADEVGRVLEEFQLMQGLRVLITGGEPLVHREFQAINDMLPRYAVRKVLFTNGFLNSPELIRGLNVDGLQVSLDGLGEAHDSLRGAGSFKRAVKCIETAAGAGLDVSVSTMVHAGNLGDFDELKGLVRDLGVREWDVDVPTPVGNMKDNPGLFVSPAVGGRYLGYAWGGGLHGGGGGGEGGEGHACGLHLMSVTPEGVCAKCAYYVDEPLGTLADGLGECWQRLRHIPLQELRCDCDALQECRGGCRYRARLLGGSEYEKDLYRCEFYGKI